MLSEITLVVILRFGVSNGSEFDRATPVCETPVGETCAYFRCGEPIEANDSGIVMPMVDIPARYIMHRDCHLFSLGVINVDGSPRERPHEPGDPDCRCNEWKHRRE
ncbi:MAG: hypothetical protein NVS1B2_15900 [Vulcanimicrobiaceae bacterium]